MAVTTYTGEFKKYQFEAVRNEIAEVLGNSVKDVPVDQITYNFIKAVEDDLGYGWYLGYGHFEYPSGIPLEDISEHLDYQFKETDIGAVICEYLQD